MQTIFWTFNSIAYFVVLTIFICLTVGIYFLLRGKTNDFIYKFLFSLTIANFSIHFIKLIFPPYVNEFYEYDNLRVLRVICFENICAVNTILGPFLFRSKNKYVKDYYMFVAFIGGLSAITIPVAPYTQRDLLSFDMFRYFFCHYTLFVVPLYMYIFKVHNLNYKRAWALPISFFMCMILVYVNENVTYDLGWVENKRNFSLVYGPPNPNNAVGKILLSIVPNILKNYTNQNGEIVVVAPLIWLVFPFILYIYPASYILNILLDFRRFKADFIEFINKKKKKRVEN